MEIAMNDVILPGIYQVFLTNFGGEAKYQGQDYREAQECAVWCGFESQILLDGALIATYSPISGWRKYK
jgi:hypothetical protein